MSGTMSSKPLAPDITKRDFLKTAGAALASAVLTGVPAVGRAESLTPERMIRMSLVEGVDALRAGKVSSVDYCMAALAQASTFKDYNIFTQVSFVHVQSAATAIDKKRKEGKPVGALQGVPYALKDSVDMVEYYTISGHPSLKTFEPKMDADLVQIYRHADAVCIGKTQIPALSLWWTTENPMTGDTGNPFNKVYKTGGSSGGSGAAVAARIVPFAVAEDTGGSIRVPAAFNGVQGFRPTTGRWPTAGTMPIGFSDTLGPIARSVADIKRLDAISAIDHPQHTPTQVDVKRLRVGYQKAGFFDELHPWVQRNIDATMNTLSRSGVTLVEVTGLPAQENFDLAIGILLADFAGSVARYFNRHSVYDKSAFGLMHELHMDAFKKIWLPGMDSSATGEEYFKLVTQLMRLRDAYRKVMTENRLDALLYPTTKVPNTPNDGGDVIAGKGPLGQTLAETQIGANMLFAPAQKTPSISMFSGLDPAGLPLSVTLDGYSGEDRKLLDIAEAIERVLPPLLEPKMI